MRVWRPVLVRTSDTPRDRGDDAFAGVLHFVLGPTCGDLTDEGDNAGAGGHLNRTLCPDGKAGESTGEFWHHCTHDLRKTARCSPARQRARPPARPAILT